MKEIQRSKFKKQKKDKCLLLNDILFFVLLFLILWCDFKWHLVSVVPQAEPGVTPMCYPSIGDFCFKEELDFLFAIFIGAGARICYLKRITKIVLH